MICCYTDLCKFEEFIKGFIGKQSFLIEFELRLRSKLLKYVRRKRQRNCLKIVAMQAL